jgi:polyphosphate kinase 2 (PPK2 family)
VGFCAPDEYRPFLRPAPIFERMLVGDGVRLRKYWLSVSDGEQEARFRSRLEDPRRRWKLAPMGSESIMRWEEYSRAKDDMTRQTDAEPAPGYVVESGDKRKARIY